MRIIFHLLRSFFGLTCIAWGLTTSTCAVAAEAKADDINHGEQWSGLAATETSYYTYSGVVYAPFADIRSPGFRLRIAGGYGQYYYDSSRNVFGETTPVRFFGETGALDAMLGYQLHFGQWISKIFIGMEYQEHVISPHDPGNSINGQQTGLKIASENWFNVSDAIWASLDANYSTNFNAYSGEFKLGVNVIGPIHLGGVIGGYGNDTLDASRAGLLLRYKDEAREITLTGGYSGDYDAPTNPYASLTYLSSF